MAQRNQANQAHANPAQPRVAAAALARRVVVPKPFSAKFEDDWLQWIFSFNSACEVNGYGDADRIRFRAALFEGTAQQVFQHVSATNANATYQQLCHLLANQFEPPQQQQMYESQLHARIKSPSESQTVFASALRSLAQRAFPGQGGAVVDRIVLQQFIDGQHTPEVRLLLALNRPPTLDEAVQRAISVSAAYQLEATKVTPQPSWLADIVAATSSFQTARDSGHQNVDSQAEMLKLLRNIDAKLSALQCSPSQIPSPSVRNTERRPPRLCYACGLPGHFAYSCPNRATAGPRPFNQGN